MGSFRQTCSVLAGLLCGPLVAGATEAGIHYVSQTREVEAAATHLSILDEFIKDPTVKFGGAGERQVRSTTGLGRFDAAVRAEYLQSDEPDYQEANLRQTSELSPTAVHVSGRFDTFSHDEMVRYRSHTRATFEVASVPSYTLTASLALDEFMTVNNGSFGPDGWYAVRLQHVTVNGDVPVIDITGSSAFDLWPDRSGHLPADHQGMLVPGRYELEFSIDGIFGAGTQVGHYSFDLTTDSQRPAAVPLPPAGLAGLLTMGVTVGVGRARRCYRRTHTHARC